MPPVIAFSPNPSVTARLALLHGVVPGSSPAVEETGRLERLGRLVEASGLVRDGATVVLVSTTVAGGSAPNLLGVERVSAAQ